MHLSAKQAEMTELKIEHSFGVYAGICLPGSRGLNQRGFTLVELITIIIILGIISVVAIPRFFDRGTFDSRRYHDEVISTLRYAQKTAIAQHRTVCVAFTPGSVTLTIDNKPAPDGVCNGNLTNLSGQPYYVVNAPNGVLLSGYSAPLNFDRLGRASLPQNINVGDYPTAIQVDAETGYVR